MALLYFHTYFPYLKALLRARQRGVAALEYTLILMFMGLLMGGITYLVVNKPMFQNPTMTLLQGYYYRGLLGIMIEGTP